MRKGVAVTQCGSGVAVGFDVVRAGEVAASKALAEFGDGQPDFACVFVHAPEADDVAGALISAAVTTGATRSIGCSATHGVIGGGHGIEDASAVSVFVLRDPLLHVRAFHLEVMRTSEAIAVVGMPQVDVHDRLAMVLADAYSFPIEGFVDESFEMLPGLKLAGRASGGTHRARLDALADRWSNRQADVDEHAELLRTATASAHRTVSAHAAATNRRSTRLVTPGCLRGAAACGGGRLARHGMGLFSILRAPKRRKNGTTDEHG